eukprot:TRINITY_DN2664_c0_g1_i1.p1 TRINITY_DN2664_c0_g1~~TRINITY_DN2664_c0_g1_i1.p1  ORF type:complete len:2284 (-),score=589.59 TRINITY_DN2664_c0_g1_i1:63-6614(-)
MKVVGYEVLSTNPTDGKILIKGENFPSVGNYTLYVGSTLGTTTRMSKTELICTFSGYRTQDITLRISNLFFSLPSFTFDEPVITSVNSTDVYANGTYIEVIGSGFGIGPVLAYFGYRSVSATIKNDGIIIVLIENVGFDGASLCLNFGLDDICYGPFSLVRPSIVQTIPNVLDFDVQFVEVCGIGFSNRPGYMTVSMENKESLIRSIDYKNDFYCALVRFDVPVLEEVSIKVSVGIIESDSFSISTRSCVVSLVYPLVLSFSDELKIVGKGFEYILEENLPLYVSTVESTLMIATFTDVSNSIVSYDVCGTLFEIQVTEDLLEFTPTKIYDGVTNIVIKRLECASMEVIVKFDDEIVSSNFDITCESGYLVLTQISVEIIGKEGIIVTVEEDSRISTGYLAIFSSFVKYGVKFIDDEVYLSLGSSSFFAEDIDDFFIESQFITLFSDKELHVDLKQVLNDQLYGQVVLRWKEPPTVVFDEYISYEIDRVTENVLKTAATFTINLGFNLVNPKIIFNSPTLGSIGVFGQQIAETFEMMNAFSSMNPDNFQANYLLNTLDYYGFDGVFDINLGGAISSVEESWTFDLNDLMLDKFGENVGLVLVDDDIIYDLGNLDVFYFYGVEPTTIPQGLSVTISINSTLNPSVVFCYIKDKSFSGKIVEDQLLCDVVWNTVETVELIVQLDNNNITTTLTVFDTDIIQRLAPTLSQYDLESTVYATLRTIQPIEGIRLYSSNHIVEVNFIQEDRIIKVEMPAQTSLPYEIGELIEIQASITSNIYHKIGNFEWHNVQFVQIFATNIFPLVGIPVRVRFDQNIPTHTFPVCDVNGRYTAGFIWNSYLVCSIPFDLDSFTNGLLRISLAGPFDEDYIDVFQGYQFKDIALINSTSEVRDVCKTSHFPAQMRKERAKYNVSKQLFDVAIGANASIANEVNSIQYYFDFTLTNGDRCCVDKSNNFGQCGLEFVNIDEAYVVMKLERPAYLNMLVTAWKNPCYQQPNEISIEYASVRSYPGHSEWNSRRSVDAEPNTDLTQAEADSIIWTPLVTHYTGKGETPVGIVPRVCSSISSNYGDESLCADVLEEYIIADYLRFSWPNRLADRARAHLMALEAHGIFMAMPYKIYGTWLDVETKPGPERPFSLHPMEYMDYLELSTDFSVDLPNLRIATENIEGVLLGDDDIDSGYDVTVYYAKRKGYRPFKYESEMTFQELADLDTLLEKQMLPSEIESELEYLTIVDGIISETSVVSSNGAFDVSIRLNTPLVGSSGELFIILPPALIPISCPLIVYSGKPRVFDISGGAELYSSFTVVALDPKPILTLYDAAGNLANMTLGSMLFKVELQMYNQSTNVYKISEAFVNTEVSFVAEKNSIELDLNLASPAVGDYRLVISAINEDLSEDHSFYTYVQRWDFKIGPGEPYTVEFDMRSHAIVQNFVEPNPSIRILIKDYLGQTVDSHDTVRLTLSSDPAHVIEYNAIETRWTDVTTGRHVFDQVVYSGQHGTSFTLFVKATYGNLLMNATSPALAIASCSMFFKSVPISYQPVRYECQCSAGYEPVGDSCQACEIGTYKTTISNEKCLSCPGGKSTRSVATTVPSKCACIGNYLEINNECVDCLTDYPGLRCIDGNANGSYANYWTSTLNSTDVYSCVTSACEDTVYSVTGCGQYHSGPLCSICDEGTSKIGKNCSPCNDKLWLDILLVFLVVLFIIAWVLFLINSAKTPRSLASLFMRIGMNHFQILYSIGEFGTQWPSMLKSFFGMAGSASGNVSIPAFACWIGVTFEVESYAYYVFPLAISLIFFFVNFCKPKVEGFRFPPDATRAFLSVLYAFYSMSVSRALKGIHCIEISGESLLAADLRINCMSEEYGTLKNISYIALFGYGLGTPLLFAALLYSDRRKLQSGKADKVEASPSLFLSSGYDTHAYMWEITIILRKVLVSFVSIYLAHDISSQLNFGVGVIGIFLIVHAFMHPFTSEKAFTFELLSLMLLFTTMICGVGLNDDQTPSNFVTFIGFALLIGNVIFLSVVFVLFARERYIIWKRGKDSSNLDLNNMLLTIDKNAREMVQFHVNPLTEKYLDEKTLAEIKKPHEIIEFEPIGPYVLMFSELVKEKLLTNDTDFEIVQEIKISFVCKKLNRIETTLEYINWNIPKVNLIIELDQLKEDIKLSNQYSIQDIELNGPNLYRYLVSKFLPQNHV